MRLSEIMTPESLRANDGSGNELRPMNFDPLEVLSYLEKGFVSSPLDRWFTGDSPPSLAPSDVIIRPFNSVRSAVETARSFLRKQLSDERRSATDDTSKIDMTEDDRRASRGSEMSVVSSMCAWFQIRVVKADNTFDSICWDIASDGSGPPTRRRRKGGGA